MEKQHAYTVEEARGLLLALQKADTFRFSQRTDPWYSYRTKIGSIERDYEQAVQNADRERADTIYHFNEWLPRSLVRDLLTKTDTTGETEQIILAETQNKLDALQKQHDTALSLAGTEDPNLVTEQFEQEKVHVVTALTRLISGPFFVSEMSLKDAGLLTKEVTPEVIKGFKESVLYGNQGGLRAHSLSGICAGPLASMIAQIGDKRRERRLKIAEKTKADKVAKLRPAHSSTLAEVNFQVGEREIKTLQKVLDQCRNFFVRRMGINPAHAAYVETEDLTFEDFKLALAAAPRALQDLAFEALRALQRDELLGVLVKANGFRKYTESSDQESYDLLDPKIIKKLSGVGSFTREGFVPVLRSMKLTHERTSSTPSKVFLSGQSIGNAELDRAKGSFLYQCDIRVSAIKKDGKNPEYNDLKLVGCKGGISGVKINSSKLFAFEGELKESELNEVCIRVPRGRFQSNYFNACSLEVGDGFTAEAGVFAGGQLTVREGACIKGVSFYRSAFRFTSGGENVVFEGCDFAGQDFVDRELVEVAKRSKACEFNADQLARLAAKGITADAIKAKDADRIGLSLDRVIATDEGVVRPHEEWDSLLPHGSHADVDMLDPERRKLKGVPPSEVLSQANLDNDFDPRNIAKPLTRETIYQLPVRVRAYQALVEFVKSNPKATDIDFKTWWEFFHTLGDDTAAACFGINETILEMDGAYLDALPKDISVLVGHRRGRVERVSRASDGLKEFNGYLSIKDKWDSGLLHEVSRFTKHQWLKQKLHRYLLNLHKFGLYINGLVGKGYVYPELSEEVNGFEFEALVHPDVHAKLGENVQGNDLALPAGSSVVNVSSASNNDGKSTLQAAIALAVSEGQSGLPVPAKKARLNPLAVYDAIMVMPNTRADAGQGDGVMRERVKTYAELKARVEAAAGKRVLVLMDEISMGATNARQASTFDTNTVLEVVSGIQGVDATVIAIVQDAEEIVPRWKTVLGTKRVKIFAHTDAEAPYQFVESETAVSSKPDAILKEMGMDHLMVETGWKVTD